MLDKLPETLGKALAGVRAGLDDTLVVQLPGVPASLAVTSPAFGEGGLLDRRFTADGRSAIVAAVRAHAIARGRLIGLFYRRG